MHTQPHAVNLSLFRHSGREGHEVGQAGEGKFRVGGPPVGPGGVRESAALAFLECEPGEEPHSFTSHLPRVRARSPPRDPR